MSDAAALLAAILDNPADDTARLVYADVIEDAEPGRAEFVRLQVELARLPESTWAVIPDDVWEKAHRAELLLSDGGWFPVELAGAPVFKTRPLGAGNCGVEYEADDGENPHIIFRRGFPARLTLPAPAGLGELLARWPLEEVRVGADRFTVGRFAAKDYWTVTHHGVVITSSGGFPSRAALVAGVEAWVAARLPADPPADALSALGFRRVQ